MQHESFHALLFHIDRNFFVHRGSGPYQLAKTENTSILSTLRQGMFYVICDVDTFSLPVAGIAKALVIMILDLSLRGWSQSTIHHKEMLRSLKLRHRDTLKNGS